MAKRKVSKDQPEEKKSFWTTLPGMLTAAAGLITAVAGLVAAINSTIELFPSKAMQTPVPPSFTATAVPTPVFTTRFNLYAENNPNPAVEQVEFDYKPGILPEDTIHDFIRLSNIDFGGLEPDDIGFNIQLILHNTSAEQLVLVLTDRFFSLVDAQGQEAELVYFCCASKRGELLGAGQERTIQLLFRGPSGWFGKNTSANYIFIRVDGLLPITRLAWRMHTLQTAD
jgi:hypothetical protein